MEEFAKIKDEVPSAIMDSHMKLAAEAKEKGGVEKKIQTLVEFDYCRT